MRIPELRTVAPPDLPAPSHSDPMIEGWAVNEHKAVRGEIDAVDRAWSTSHSHGRYHRGTQIGGSQGARALYSTEALANRAAAHYVRAHARVVVGYFERMAATARPRWVMRSEGDDWHLLFPGGSHALCGLLVGGGGYLEAASPPIRVHRCDTCDEVGPPRDEGGP